MLVLNRNRYDYKFSDKNNTVYSEGFYFLYLHILPLSTSGGICVSLSVNVLRLWNIRLFVLIVILYVICDHYTESTLFSFSSALIFHTIFSVYFVFRRRSFSLVLTGNNLTINGGIFVHKTLNLKPENIISVSNLSTPLCSHLGLSYLVLYCQGAFFILPPLTRESTDMIIKAIKNEAVKNEE